MREGKEIIFLSLCTALIMLFSVNVFANYHLSETKELEYGETVLEENFYVDWTDIHYVAIDSKGKYIQGTISGDYEPVTGTIQLPHFYKIGDTLTVRLSGYDEETDSYMIETQKVTITAPGPVNIMDVNYVYPKTRKLKFDVENVHKGDKIKVKIGKKTYTKKITRNYSDKRITVKIKKPKAGSKITYWIVNKFNQKLTGKGKEVVYKYKKIRKGMTKKQVKLTSGWRYGRKSYTSSTETWHCGSGKYVIFKNGVVWNYYYSE